jgi:hypothetical protein
MHGGININASAADMSRQRSSADVTMHIFKQSEQDKAHLSTTIARLKANSAETQKDAQEEGRQNTIRFQHQTQGLEQTISALQIQIQTLQKHGAMNDVNYKQLRARH